MNFADIERTWRSPHNRPSPAELEKQQMNFVAELRRRRRGQALFLALVFAALAFITGKLGLHVLWPDAGKDSIDFSREWGIIPFFALPWIGWWIMMRRHRRHGARHAGYTRSIQASLAALLDENAAERTRYKVVPALLAASAVVLALVVFQLRAVGKAGDEILIPAFVIYPAYVVLMLVWSAYYRRRKLEPRRRELETLLKAYENANGDSSTAR